MDTWSIGNNNNTKIDDTNAITPNNLFGIPLKIAYWAKKYHSGTIWAGVTKGSASM